MTEEAITQAFTSYAQGKGINVDNLSVSDFPRQLIDYYRDVELPEVDRAGEGDLLLFQYGTYDWGDGPFFEVDFTRQFYKYFADSDDHEILQQRFTFYFDAANFQQFVSFNLWSNSVANIEEFERLIVNSEGYRESLRYRSERFETSVADVC